MPTSILGAITGVAGMLLSFLLLAGCATSDSSQMGFSKAGVSAADRQKDENECLRASVTGNDQTRILVPFEVDRSRFRACMESRGYSATPTK